MGFRFVQEDCASWFMIAVYCILAFFTCTLVLDNIRSASKHQIYGPKRAHDNLTYSEETSKLRTFRGHDRWADSDLRQCGDAETEMTPQRIGANPKLKCYIPVTDGIVARRIEVRNALIGNS